MSWEEVAKFLEEVYGDVTDFDEEFFICPNCGEPIYKCDYPSFEEICPVCENRW